MKKAIMYGAGNIGRGFIGQLFYKSGYEVAFIEINPTVLERLNTDKCYPVRIVKDEKFTEEMVENVRGVNGADMALVAEEIATADIMATAIGVNILPRIAKPIAMGLKKRWEMGNHTPFNIIICENLIDANHYLAGLVRNELSEEERRIFDSTVGLVEASIGRMVPVMTSEMLEENPLRICVEEYCELPVDKEAFKGEIPNIVNMVPFSPFDFFIQRKLFMHNMGHATSAYLGYLCNYTYIWESCENPAVKLAALRALQESALAMSLEHNVPLQKLLAFADDLLYRFGNKLLGDTIERVGKDPIRKLSENDRLVGAAKLCMKHGVNPVYISLGIAAALVFKPESDEFAKSVQGEINANGVEAAITRFCNIQPGNLVFTQIMDFYKLLKQGTSLDKLIIHTEKMKTGKLFK